MSWVPPLRAWNKENVPTSPHPGSFGVQRRFHFHEGVDIYTPQNAQVYAMEPGVIVAIRQFTGAAVGSPWWEDTDAVFSGNERCCRTEYRAG